MKKNDEIDEAVKDLKECAQALCEKIDNLIKNLEKGKGKPAG